MKKPIILLAMLALLGSEKDSLGPCKKRKDNYDRVEMEKVRRVG